MSFAHALKTAIALKEYKDEVAKKKATKEKEWDENVLNKGGVSWWNRKVVKQVLDKKTGVVKNKVTVQKVKVTVLTQDQDPCEFSGKGKFSFRNACGNRIYLSVKSYDVAYEFVSDFYGKVGINGFYTVSKEV